MEKEKAKWRSNTTSPDKQALSEYLGHYKTTGDTNQLPASQIRSPIKRNSCLAKAGNGQKDTKPLLGAGKQAKFRRSQGGQAASNGFLPTRLGCKYEKQVGETAEVKLRGPCLEALCSECKTTRSMDASQAWPFDGRVG